MKSKALTDMFIRKLKEPGVYCDRDGLRLQVTKNNKNTESLRKSWLVHGSRRQGPGNGPRLV